MRARPGTIAVFAVVGGVVAAAAVDALTGQSASRAPAGVSRAATRQAPVPTPAAAILFGVQRVEVGIRSRHGGGQIRVVTRRLRLGPGVGTPSGERIALWAWNPSAPSLDGIYTRDAAGGALRRITASPRGWVQQPLAYSPDGSRLLLFEARRGRHNGRLDVVRADGRHLTILTPGGMRSWCCALGAPADWSRGGLIAFAAFAPAARGRTGHGAVYVADAGGSDVRRVTPTTSWTTTARWSPDGRWIAFDQADRTGGAHGLFLVHPNGTGLRMLGTAMHDDGSRCARWSPDGRSLVYVSGAPGRPAGLWTVNVDGTGVLRLSAG